MQISQFKIKKEHSKINHQSFKRYMNLKINATLMNKTMKTCKDLLTRVMLKNQLKTKNMSSITLMVQVQTIIQLTHQAQVQ